MENELNSQYFINLEIINKRTLIPSSSYEIMCKNCNLRWTQSTLQHEENGIKNKCKNCNKETQIKVINQRNKYDDFTILLEDIVKNLGQKFLENEMKNIENSLNPFKKNILQKVNIDKIDQTKFFDDLCDKIKNDEYFSIRYNSLQKDCKTKVKKNQFETILEGLKILFHKKKDLLAYFLLINRNYYGIKDVEFVFYDNNGRKCLDENDKLLNFSYDDYKLKIGLNNNNFMNSEWNDDKVKSKSYKLNLTEKHTDANIENIKGRAKILEEQNLFDEREVLEEENESIIEKQDSITINQNSFINDIKLLNLDKDNDDFLNERIKDLDYQKEKFKSEIIKIDNYNHQEIIQRLNHNSKKYNLFQLEKYEKIYSNHEKILLYLKRNKELFNEIEYQSCLESEIRHHESKLRIYNFKYDILKSISKNTITIIVAETGSGKSTQIIQYFELVRLKNTKDKGTFPFLCTQPRKVSTLKIAKRVAEETKLKFEDEVYPIINLFMLNNFEEISKKSKYIFINETLLLYLLIKDPMLPNINFLILDEAHERSINLDIILFLIRNYTLKKRKDFRLVITSATIQPTQIMNYFSVFKPKVINCQSDNLNINYIYHNQPTSKESFMFKTLNVSIDVINNTVDNILKLKFNKIPKDLKYDNFISLLVFLPDLRTILFIKNKLKSNFKEYIERGILSIFELNSTLESSEQMDIIEYYKEFSVKVILSTKVAETSLTITNNDIVIDSGFHKTSKYNYLTKMKEEIVEMISKDSAIQRSGRTGRIKNGTCYRVYTESQFEKMNDYRTPEINLINFSHMLLKLIYFGIHDIVHIELIDQPSNIEIMTALNDLKRISAISSKKRKIKDTEEILDNLEGGLYEITSFGRWLYDLQIDPFYGKIIYNTMNKFPKAQNDVLKLISILIANDYLFFNFNKRNSQLQFLEEIHELKNNLIEKDESYIYNLSKKIVQNVIVANQDEEIILEEIDSLNLIKENGKKLNENYEVLQSKKNEFEYYQTLFEALDPFFNKEVYLVNNMIPTLGDLMINLFYYRQINLIRCQLHFSEIYNNLMYIPDLKECFYCQKIITFYLLFYNYNTKNFIIAENNYTNLKSLLKKKNNYRNNNYFSEKIIKNEFIISFWTRIYIILYRKDYQNLIGKNIIKIEIEKKYNQELLFQLKNINFKTLYNELYQAYRIFYLDSVGPIFLGLYQENFGIKPSLIILGSIEKNEFEYLEKGIYTLLDSKTKARIAPSSTYLKYFEKKNLFNYTQEEINIPNEKIFYLSSYDNNENILLKNANPVFRELYQYIDEDIRCELHYIKKENTSTVFCFKNIGEYLFKILLERKRNLLINNNFQRHPLSDEETEIMLKMQVYHIKENSSLIFFTNNQGEKEKKIVENIIDKELYNVRENLIDEIGTLRNDCLLLKLRQGMNIINIEHNKDHINYEIIFLKRGIYLWLLEELFHDNNMKYNKIFESKSKSFISFTTNYQANEFLKNLQQNTEMSSLIFVKLPNYEIRHNNYSERIIMNIIGPNIHNNKIFMKIENYGKISDIFIRNIDTEHKIIKFTMEKNSDARNLLMTFVDHTDNWGHWSSCKKIENNLTLTINNLLIINDPDFLKELQDFADYNEINISFIGRNRLILENSTEEKIRKFQFFINDDLIYISEFALFEIKNNYKNTFLKGQIIKDFCTNNKVLIQIIHYFKKIHIYGTPERRKSVKDLITQYLDDLNSSLLNNIIQIPEGITLRTIYNFIEKIKNDYNREQIGIILNFNKFGRILDIQIRKEYLERFISDCESNLKKQELNSRVSIKSIKNQNTICVICLEDLLQNNIFTLTLCGHNFCKECLQSYIKSQINSIPIIDLPLSCVTCKQVILNTDIFNLFLKAEIDYILYQLTKTFMTNKLNSDKFNWCENPDCSFIYNKRQLNEYNLTVRNCPNCNKTYCTLCTIEIINNSHNQECKQIILNKFSEEDQKWLRKNTINCVKCNFVYEKSEGCNHMICKKCKPEVHFCFLCGKEIQPEFVHMHYNDYKKHPFCYQKLYQESNKLEYIEEEKSPFSLKEEEKSSNPSKNKENMVNNKSKEKEKVEINFNMLMHNVDNKNEYKMNKSFFENEIEYQNEVKNKKMTKNNLITLKKDNIIEAFKEIDDNSDSKEDFEIKIKISSEDSISNHNFTKKIVNSNELKKDSISKKDINREEEEINEEESFILEFTALIKKRQIESDYNKILKENAKITNKDYEDYSD